jgi:hypothetical protein
VGRRFSIDVDSGVSDIRCVWCERGTQAWATRTFQGAVYVCECGAMVLFAPPHDFDEAGEELLGHLGIAGEVAEPAQPVGSSGMVAVRHYDGAVSRRKLMEVLKAAGYDTYSEDIVLAYVDARAPDRPGAASWGVWWRPGACR